MRLQPGNVKGEAPFECREPLRIAGASLREEGESLRAVYLLRVGAIPVDGVSVGHHLGSRVLAVHTHPKDKDEEDEEHFHLRHICSGSPTKPS